MSLPSIAEPTLGTEKWSPGSTIVALRQAGRWTVGAFWNQLWSFSGNESREDVNQMFVQPFFAYTTQKALTITLQSESVGNFNADDDQWTVPINLLFSKVAAFGTFPASYQIGFGGSAFPRAHRHGRSVARSCCCSRGDDECHGDRVLPTRRTGWNNLDSPRLLNTRWSRMLVCLLRW